MRSAAPPKLRSGNAARKSVMNTLMSACPRRGSCNEYCKSMSGAASSSTMLRSHVGPQKLVNQRPTMALFSCSFDISVLHVQGMLAKASVAFASASRKLFRCRGRDTPYLAFESEARFRGGRSEFESKERSELKDRSC